MKSNIAESDCIKCKIEHVQNNVRIERGVYAAVRIINFDQCVVWDDLQSLISPLSCKGEHL